ncbi:MAG: MYG1 family protein [Nanoarchaeota archaeon]|nr:MYG1 family protein [Nanoarchaeota archaeon]
MKTIEKIAVHEGIFHADDVFAVAILKLIYPSAKIIRTRNEKILKKSDIRVDVGRNYDHENGNFDHHQQGGAGERENKIPYASAGLIWKHYGMKLVSSEEVWNNIDKKIIQFIDAHDVGLKTFTSEKTEPYTISHLISGFNPPWPNISPKLFNTSFKEAVSFIQKLLKKEIEREEGVLDAVKIIREKIKETKEEYLVLDTYIPWKEIIVNESNLKFIIYQDSLDKNWLGLAVPIEIGKFENRKDFPKEWAGLADEELEKVSGVIGAKFCHNKLFIVVAKTKQGAINLVELALKS